MSELFGTIGRKKCCNCSEIPIYPCECRLDTGHVLFGSQITTSGGSPCELEPSGPEGSILPATNRAWNPEDCTNPTEYGHTLTAFPPLCTSINPDELGSRVVFVQKLSSSPAPNIDNDIVQENDWYAVVYAVTTDTILGVFYEYELCCHNETPTNAATSHFAWLKVHGVAMGTAIYTIWIYNTITAGTYGNCGWSPIP